MYPSTCQNKNHFSFGQVVLEDGVSLNQWGFLRMSPARGEAAPCRPAAGGFYSFRISHNNRIGVLSRSHSYHM